MKSDFGMMWLNIEFSVDCHRRGLHDMAIFSGYKKIPEFDQRKSSGRGGIAGDGLIGSDWEPRAIAEKQSFFKQKLMEEGWVLSPEGWLCPRCALLAHNGEMDRPREQ